VTYPLSGIFDLNDICTVVCEYLGAVWGLGLSASQPNNVVLVGRVLVSNIPLRFETDLIS
jgi:hypothetical protein